MKFNRAGEIVLAEAQIETTCVAFMVAEGWRPFKMEQQFSEKKRKTTGEAGCADHLFLRYAVMPEDVPIEARVLVDVLWVEFKRLTAKGKATKASPAQMLWHVCERARGAITWIAGVDFTPTIEGFRNHYAASGLARKVSA